MVRTLPTVVARADWVSVVRSFEGTPYLHQGRAPGIGMDCPAPLIVAAWVLGLKPRTFDVQGYPQGADGTTLQRLCDEHLHRIDFASAREGDVLLTMFDKEGRPRHLGVLVDATQTRRYWVHAESWSHRRVMLSRLLLGDGYMRLVQAYAVPGVI